MTAHDTRLTTPDYATLRVALRDGIATVCHQRRDFTRDTFYSTAHSAGFAPLSRCGSWFHSHPFLG